MTMIKKNYNTCKKRKLNWGKQPVINSSKQRSWSFESYSGKEDILLLVILWILWMSLL